MRRPQPRHHVAQLRPDQLPAVLGEPPGLGHRVWLGPGVPPGGAIHLPDQVSRDTQLLPRDDQ